MDPYFYKDDDDLEDFVYDTYDQIIDEDDGSFAQREDDFEYDSAEHERDVFGDGLATGTAFALAEELADELRGPSDYEVNEYTDRENMSEVTSLLAARTKANLRSFEQYIDDICKGRRPLFER